jgi:hypothetical protein
MTWFKDQLTDDDVELFESNFKSSKRTQQAIVMWCDHELAKLDKETSLTKLKGIPDRGEYLLGVAAQREMLSRMKSLLLED